MAVQGLGLDLTDEDLPVVRAVLNVLEESRQRADTRGTSRTSPSFKLSSLRMALLKEKAFLDPSRVL